MQYNFLLEEFIERNHVSLHPDADFLFVTNDENIEYINKNISNIVISIDGRKEINDKMRIKYDNSSSYEQILP